MVRMGRVRDSRDQRGESRGRRPGDGNKVPCTEPGCENQATGRKPYCIDHLDKLPYVANLKSLLQVVNEEEVEADSLRPKFRHINVEGVRCQEIIDQLQLGAVSPKRLALKIAMKPSVCDNYLRRLKHEGILKVLTLGSRRGTPRKVVMLTSEPSSPQHAA